jgi:hypothetical protein
MYTRFEVKNLKERDYLEDLGVDWRLILKLTLKKQVGRVVFIHLDEERDTCGSL